MDAVTRGAAREITIPTVSAPATDFMPGTDRDPRGWAWTGKEVPILGQALIGTLLFHTLLVVSPLAGKALAGDAQIGEYFRVLAVYAVITVDLVMHAWQKARKA